MSNHLHNFWFVKLTNRNLRGTAKSKVYLKGRVKMIIKKAEKNDLQKILDLQYLAYQSEAKLFNNPNIPPLRQTLVEVESEYQKGVVLKAVDENNTIIGSVRAYYDNDTVYIGKLMVKVLKQIMFSLVLSL